MLDFITNLLPCFQKKQALSDEEMKKLQQNYETSDHKVELDELLGSLLSDSNKVSGYLLINSYMVSS